MSRNPLKCHQLAICFVEVAAAMLPLASLSSACIAFHPLAVNFGPVWHPICGTPAAFCRPSQSPAASIHLGHGESSDTPDGDGFASATRQQAPIFEADLETVEPMQPIYANLIHFPRELIATRRMRPRLSGVPQSAAEEEYGQLSIFEVDPSSISTQPEASVAGPAGMGGSVAAPGGANAG